MSARREGAFLPPRHSFGLIFYTLKTLPPRVLWMGVLSVSCMAVAVATNIYMMYAFKLLVDSLSHLSYQDPWQAARHPFLIVAGCCVTHNILHRIRTISNGYSTPDMECRLREVLTDTLLQHSQIWFSNRFAGSLATKIRNVASGYTIVIQRVLVYGLIPALSASITSSFVLWSVSPSIVGWLWIIIAGLVMLAAFVGPFIGKAAARIARRDSEITGQLVDTVSNVSSVKSFMRATHELDLLTRLHRFFLQDSRRFAWIDGGFWGAFDILVTGFVLGFIWLVVDGWYTYDLTVGDVTVCVVIAWELWRAFGAFSSVLSSLSNELGRMQEALDEIVQPFDVIDHPDAVPLNVVAGDVVFKNVTFSYDHRNPIFEGLNVHIPPRQRVGLVGLSGAGKTTFCQLLVRNYDIAEGQILIDGQNIAHASQESLRRSIAVIPQDPLLFHRTLRENIAYGLDDASEHQIMEAAKAAQAHDFIMQLPGQYNSLVGERGIKLSGGQRQRIVIARAILKNAPLLLLDEATSALDSQTERAIQSAFHTAMEGRTTLVIAHRLSTLAHLDRILVMERGRIVEDGTLSELLSLGGHFAHLWQLQSDGFLPENTDDTPP